MNVFSNCLVFVRVVGNQGYVFMLVYLFAEKSLNRLVLVWLTFTDFLITVHEIGTAGEVYLERFQTYITELCCENS